MRLIGVFLFTVSCALAQESSTVPPSADVQETTMATNATKEETSAVTTTAPQPPPEPPNVMEGDKEKGKETEKERENEKEGRSLNMTALPPLDDVTMEEEEVCVPGQPVMDKGCAQQCRCEGGLVKCSARQCPAPSVIKGSSSDPACQERPAPDQTDACCALLTCAHDAEVKPPSSACVYKNETYQKGDTFNDACEAVCSCEDGGFVSCKPRCPAVNNTKSEKCLTLPDTKDPCCTLVLCDVSLDGHDSSKADEEEGPAVRLVSVTAVNSSAVSVELSQPLPLNGSSELEMSLDGSIWSPAALDEGGRLGGLLAGKTYSFRVKMGTTLGNVLQVTVPQSKFVHNMCEYKGVNYTKGEEFHDGCALYCSCGKNGVECASIDCPTHFGLEVLDPNCLEWETQPVDFVPEPPKCCPDTVKCKDNGSCIYQGETFANWATIPSKLTGCDQECFCDKGNVTCQPSSGASDCPPVPATPPATLPCHPKEAILAPRPEAECCLTWMCPPHSGSHVDMKPTETVTMSNKTDDTMTDSSLTTVTPILGPYSPNYNVTQSYKPTKHVKNQTNNKKDYFPGPFSLQHMDDEARKGQTKQKPEVPQKTKSHKDNPLIDILAPFHLPASEIPEIHHTNISSENETHNHNFQPTSIPDSKFEDDIPDTNEGIFAHYPFLSPPLTKPSKHDKDKGRPPVYPGLEGPKHHIPFYHTYNEDHQKEFPGPFNQNNPPTIHEPNRNKSLSTDNSLPQSSQSGVGGSPYGDHEFQYERENGSPPHPHHNGGVQFNPEQGVYFIHNQEGFPQHPQQGGRPDQDMYHVQHFEIPYDPASSQQNNPEGGPPRYIKKKPIDKHQNPNEHSLPQEILTHLHSLAPHLPKGGQIPPHLNPEEIIHYVQPNPQLSSQQRHPPAHYLTPEEIYLYQNPDKVPPEGKIRIPQNPNIVNQDRDTIHIHSHNIPQSPSQRVEEILAHLRHQSPNQYPQGGQHYPLAQPHPHPNGPYESLLTQHSSHAAIPHGLLPPNTTRPGFNNNLQINGFPQHPGNQDPNEIKVLTLEAIDDSTVRLIFSVPEVLVGLHGRVELRYTSDRQNSDPATWEQQVLAPPNDLIATPELEFELGSLEPDTTYKIKISIVLRDLQNSPVSNILTVKTMPRSKPTTSYPAEIAVDPQLRVAELNSTWVKIAWRTFHDTELQFIDGVQLRYKEPHAQVFSATPLIHRAVTSYAIEDLKPDTLYQVGIYFYPSPEYATELRAQEMIDITTAIENDPYSFELVVDVHHVKTGSVELSWSGVPYPEDKYINIFRAIYQSEGEREDFSSFKVAKRDSPPSTLIQGLKPNTRYHLWLEAYLTNGRIKKSNVKDFTTKAGVLPASDSLQGKLEATPLVESSDYYGPLVGVSILATLAIAGVIILSLILARKHGHNKAPITAANNRKAQSAAYDNPSYKVEIQQETMDL